MFNVAARIATLVAVFSALVVGAGALPAQAANRDGYINEGEMVMYYNSSTYGYGSFSDHLYYEGSFYGYKFLSSGAGRGQYVKNNSAAAYNTFNSRDARVFFNSNWAGKYDMIPKNSRRNLSNTKNENASFSWVP